MEGFELVLQSRYLNQSDISTRCVEWDTREEIGGITQAFRAFTTYFRKKKTLETNLSWQTTACDILWETIAW